MGIMTVHEVNDIDPDAITDGTAQITKIINEDSSQPTESFMESLPGYELVYIATKMFSVLFEALEMTTFIYIPLLAYGVPFALAMMIQTVISLMEAMFIFQVWRKFKMEN